VGSESWKTVDESALGAGHLGEDGGGEDVKRSEDVPGGIDEVSTHRTTGFTSLEEL
jgi:hypothetical protein